MEKRSTIVDKQIICGSTCMEKERFATVFNFSELNVGDILAFNSGFILADPHIEDFEK